MTKSEYKVPKYIEIYIQNVLAIRPSSVELLKILKHIAYVIM